MKVVSISHVWREELRASLGPDVTYVTADPDDDAAVAEAVSDAEILVTTKFNAEIAARARNLKLLVCPSAGTEGIDRTLLPPGVSVINGQGHEIPIAEYVIGTLVALRQKLLQADKALRDGRWEYGFLGPGGFVGELWGSRLGLVGFGRIGHEIVPRANAFGMTVAALTMHPEKVTGASAGRTRMGGLKNADDVDELFRSSDAVVLCCELSDTTRGLVDARRLRLMPQDALIVNISRGPVADEQALFEALRDRTIAGAAIDVWYDYPQTKGDRTFPSRFPFGELDNVIMTPHSSGWTEGHWQRKRTRMADVINTFARMGRLPQ